MAACVAENTLTEWVAGRLDPQRVAVVEEHLDGCPDCFELLAQAARSTSSGRLDTAAPRCHQGIVTDAPAEIEEYSLLGRIGRGTMGQVFLALDRRLDRQVAIKLMAVELSPAARERFLIEARAVARLSHPNVVTIHRVGEIAGRPYIVYELVRGVTLDAIEKPQPWRRALELALGLSRGLAAAHRAGVLHRDIKPANAMLGDDGTVKLLDFSLAKLVESGVGRAPDRRQASEASGGGAATPPELTNLAPALTSQGALLGTPLYLPPEAWRGAAPTVSMDLYSLGALIYEVCTNDRAHHGQTLEQLREAAQARHAAPLSALVPGIDAGFAAAIDRCLERDPAARWASADALCASLEAALRRGASRARGPSRWARPPGARRCGRERARRALHDQGPRFW